MRTLCRNARVSDLVRGLLARALHRLCETCVHCGGGKCEACEKMVNGDGFFITAEETV